MTDYSVLPENLPEPQDDGAADHLPGRVMPTLTLMTSDGAPVDLAELGAGRSVLYLYPLTGRPGTDLPEGWDAIPGARGCSTEACDFETTSPNSNGRVLPASTVYLAKLPTTRPRWSSDYIFRLPCSLTPHSTWPTRLGCRHSAPRPRTSLHTTDSCRARRTGRACVLPDLSA